MGKITTTVFEPGSTTANVYGLRQYDYGQILRIQGLHLPSAVEIHFSLKETGGTCQVLCRTGGCGFGDGGEPFMIHGLGTGSGSNLVIVGNTVCKTSSSKRYKTVGRAISDEDIEQWYQIQPVWAKYKNEFVTKQSGCFNTVMPMLIAEDVEAYLPKAEVKNEKGETEDWSERVLIPAMFAMIKSQKTEIELLKSELKEIKNMIKENKNA